MVRDVMKRDQNGLPERWQAGWNTILPAPPAVAA